MALRRLNTKIALPESRSTFICKRPQRSPYPDVTVPQLGADFHPLLCQVLLRGYYIDVGLCGAWFADGRLGACLQYRKHTLHTDRHAHTWHLQIEGNVETPFMIISMYQTIIV